MSELPPPTGLPVTASATSPAQPKDVLKRVEGIANETNFVRGAVASARDHAVAAYATERDRTVLEQLERMPLDALKNASEGRLRLGAIESAGIRTVAAIRAAGRHRLEAIPGVGPVTATQALAAAEQLASALSAVTRVRFDVDSRPQQQTALLNALRSFDIATRNVEPLRPRLHSMKNAIDADLDAARLESQRVKVSSADASGRKKPKPRSAGWRRSWAAQRLPCSASS